MIEFSEVSSVIRAGRTLQRIFGSLTMRLPTDRRLAILVKSTDVRQELVQLICGSKEPTTGLIERRVRVSYPVGFSSGFYPKLTVLGNIGFVAALFGLDRRSFIELVVPLLGDDPQLDTSLADLPQTFRANLAYCISYAVPFDVYVANNVLMPSNQALRSRLSPLLDARLETSGLILVTAMAPIAQAVCQEGAVLHREELTLFPSVKAAVSFFREIEEV